MDHSLHTRLDRTSLTEDMLINAPIYGANDETVGRVSHVHGGGTITGVVVDVGGFLGIGAKPVMLNLDQISFMRDEDDEVHGVVSYTKDQLRQLPEHLD